jgi:hypothetical protein
LKDHHHAFIFRVNEDEGSAILLNAGNWSSMTQHHISEDLNRQQHLHHTFPFWMAKVKIMHSTASI